MEFIVQCGSDSAPILQKEGSETFEVAHWNEDELEDPDVEGAGDTAVTLAKNNSEQLIRRLNCSIDAWEAQREDRRW